MYQLNLPLGDLVKDRGRLNTLRNMIASIASGLQESAEETQRLINFIVNEFPVLLRNNSPFPLVTTDASHPQLSPLDFQIHDLTSRNDTQQVFNSVKELWEKLDIQSLSALLRDAEIIGIDESKVDIPLPQSNLTYLKSIAFRSFLLPDGSRDEAVGPIISDFRVQMNEDKAFENENQLLGYIRNNYIAYLSALTALAYGRRPYIVLHGPLVRAIGAFSEITFSYEEAEKLLNLNLADAGEFDLPHDSRGGVVLGDEFTVHNLSLAPKDATQGEKNLHEFNNFCINVCGKKCEGVPALKAQKAVPADDVSTSLRSRKNRTYPGFCVYFWVLRSLFDLCRLSETKITSVVENVSAATEMTRLTLPSFLDQQIVRQQLSNTSIQPILENKRIDFQLQQARLVTFRNARRLIESGRLMDSMIFSYALAEGQYTSPVQIYRYRDKNTFSRLLNETEIGIDHKFEPLLSALFSSETQPSHPGYKVMMSYLRTTPLREPVRVEYFGLPFLNEQHRKVIGSIFLLSLPYQEYGLPIILYYADKLARTPTQLVKTIVEREYLEIVLRQSLAGVGTDPVTYLRLIGRLTRNYFQREGM